LFVIALGRPYQLVGDVDKRRHLLA
jgi:hypothetical protein